MKNQVVDDMAGIARGIDCPTELSDFERTIRYLAAGHACGKVVILVEPY